MSTTRLVLSALAAVALGLLATAAGLMLMLDGQTVSLQMALPMQAMLAPMIGVVVFWLALRALRVPLDPVKCFLVGAIVVYGTFYVTGRLVSVGVTSEAVGSLLGLAIVTAAGIAAAWRAGQEAW